MRLKTSLAVVFWLGLMAVPYFFGRLAEFFCKAKKQEQINTF